MATGPGIEPFGATYDQAANRATWDGEPVVHDEADRQLGVGDHTTYAWDAHGNLASRVVDGVTTTFEWSVAGQLVAVRDGAGQPVAEYAYDGQGRRVSKVVGGVETIFVYGPMGLVAELDAAGHELRSYGWLPGQPWQTAPLCMRQGGQTYFYVNDHLGAPRRLIDEEGQVVWSARVDAFGRAWVDPGSTVESPWRGSGQYFDAETGLHHNTCRIYDPQMGRYLSPDPILEEGGTSLYAFADNAPTVAIDPWGLAPAKRGIGITGWPFGDRPFAVAGCISVGAYAGIGGEASLCVSFHNEDCCTPHPENKLIRNGKRVLAIEGAVEGGLGVGGTAGIVGAQLKGFTVRLALGCTASTKCGLGLSATPDFECCLTASRKYLSLGASFLIVSGDITAGEEGSRYYWQSGSGQAKATRFQRILGVSVSAGLSNDNNADATVGEAFASGQWLLEENKDIPIPFLVQKMADLANWIGE